jgi:hypothetical protein
MFNIHGHLWVLLYICIINQKVMGFRVPFVCILVGCSALTATNQAVYCNKEKKVSRVSQCDMYTEWKKVEFPKEYSIRIWKQQDQEVDQEIDGKMK